MKDLDKYQDRLYGDKEDQEMVHADNFNVTNKQLSNKNNSKTERK
jgi:hypothetical protein